MKKKLSIIRIRDSLYRFKVFPKIQIKTKPFRANIRWFYSEIIIAHKVYKPNPYVEMYRRALAAGITNEMLTETMKNQFEPTGKQVEWRKFKSFGGNNEETNL